jgi:hypothetical protein
MDLQTNHFNLYEIMKKKNYKQIGSILLIQKMNLQITEFNLLKMMKGELTNR